MNETYDQFGRTALGTAIIQENIELVRLLLSAGAKIKKRDAINYSPPAKENPIIADLLNQYNAVIQDQGKA